MTHLKSALNKGDSLSSARGAEQGQGMEAPTCAHQHRSHCLALLNVQLLCSQLLQESSFPVQLLLAWQLCSLGPLHRDINDESPQTGLHKHNFGDS